MLRIWRLRYGDTEKSLIKTQKGYHNEAYSQRQFWKVNRIRYLPTGKDGKLLQFPVLSIRSLNINFILSSIFFFVFWIKFGKTKQKIVALVATTFEALVSVAKTNCWLSGCEFYAGNIDNLFGNMLAHIYPPVSIQKVRQPKSAHRKTPTPIVAKQSLHNIGSL